MESRIPATNPRGRWFWPRTTLVVGLGALAPLLILMATLLLLTRPATAAVATDVSGSITTPTTWTLAGSPYIVTSTVTVEGGGVLTIEAGVEVRFDAGAELRITTGPLIAEGSPTQPITFTANSPSPARGFWDRIFFDDTSLPSTLRHCLVEYAGTGVAVGGDTDFHTISHCTLRYNGDGGDWTSGGAINSAGDVLTLTHNLVYSNELGIRLRKSFGDVITGNRIYDNDGFGIGFLAANAPGGGNSLVADNQVHDNGGFGIGFVPQGIYDGGSNNTIVNNQVYNNVATGAYRGDGLYLDTGANNVITGNLIYGNAGHGLWARSQPALQFIGNIVRGNGQNGLTYDSLNSAPAALHSNVLCNNGGFEIENQWASSLLAEGNWFGVNTPALGVEISGVVDFTPWISLAVAVAPDTLPADGVSTAALTLTMTGGGYAVPNGYTATISATEGGVSPPVLTLTNGQATATYTAGAAPGPVDIPVTDGCATITPTLTLTLQAVDLAVYKVGPGGVAWPGERVTYTIGVSELNGVDALNTVITDLLPVGAAWYSDTSAACGLTRTSTATNVVWTRSVWTGGSACWFDLVVQVEGAACQSDRLVNTVVITSAAADDDPSNNAWTTGLDSPALACLDLAVSKADGGLRVGLNKDYAIEYTIAVTNTGPTTVTSVVLTDVLPLPASYSGSDWTCVGGVCSYAVGQMVPSATAQLTLPLALDKNALDCPIVLTNTVRVASVGSSGGDLNPTNNVFTLTSVFACLPDLVVVLNDNVGPTPMEAAWLYDLLDLLPEGPDQQVCVYPGQWITYTIAYVNTGLVTATQVALTETLPAHTSYVGPGWTHAGGDTYTRSVGLLPPGMGGAAHFVVRVDTAPPDLRVEDEVRIGGAEADLHPPDNVSYDDTPICEGLWLQMVKDDHTPCAFPGDEIRYTIVVTNPSGETATGVTLTETLPAHTAYLTSPGWLPLGGGQYTYDYGDLGPYQSASIEFVVMVNDPLSDTVTQTVNVVCLGYDGPTPPNHCYTLVTPLPLAPDLRVVKEDHIGPPPPLDVQRRLDRMYQALYNRPYEPPQTRQGWAPVEPGDVYSYTITYLNLGRRPATGVVLTETLPEHTTYVGYGWTHVGGDTYLYEVGDLDVGQGGQRTFWVQVDGVPCSKEYLYNWVHIGGSEAECNLNNNWSGEETPVLCAPFHFYLPLVMKGYPPTGPTPTPTPPTPTPTPTTPPPPPQAAYVSDVAVNEVTNRVYVASPQLDTVFAVDPTGPGSIVAAIPVGDHPVGLAVVTTTNKIYAANLNSWTLTAIQGSDHTPITDIYVGAQACKVAADAGDARVYVTNHLESDNGAAAVNSQTDAFLYYYTRMHATQGRYGIDVDPAAEKLFIAARDAGLIAIQDAYLPDQDPLVFKLDPPRVPFVAAFNPATNHLFVTAADDNLVVVLDPYSIQWSRGRWVMWQGRWVFVLNRANAGWIKEIGVGLGAEEGIAVNPRTGYVYVTNADSDTVSILRDAADPADIQWVMDLAVGDYPQGVAVDVKANLIYVGNAGSRDLTVIDGATHTVIKTIPLE